MRLRSGMFGLLILAKMYFLMFSFFCTLISRFCWNWTHRSGFKNCRRSLLFLFIAFALARFDYFNWFYTLSWETCKTAIYHPANIYNSSLTWESLSPKRSASFFLSGLLMYFCIWNLFSKPFRCESLMRNVVICQSTFLFNHSNNEPLVQIPENTARLIIPRRGFPLVECAHGNPCPINNNQLLFTYILN